MKPRSKQEALMAWGKVAAGDIGPDVAAWLAGVARDLIAATEEKDANRRRLATVRAVGLDGRESRDAYLSRFIIEDVLPRMPAADRAKAAPMLVGVVTNHVPGVASHEVSPEALRKRVARARKAAAKKSGT